MQRSAGASCLPQLPFVRAIYYLGVLGFAYQKKKEKKKKERLDVMSAHLEKLCKTPVLFSGSEVGRDDPQRSPPAPAML